MYKELYQEMRNVFSSNLKKIRKEKGFTQEQIAQKSHIARSTYIAYEQGHTIPDAITLKLMAEAFNISTDEILGHKVDKTQVINRKAWWDEV